MGQHPPWTLEDAYRCNYTRCSSHESGLIHEARTSAQKKAGKAKGILQGQPLSQQGPYLLS